ncbi:MAG: suppressor for copper-sensitivity [Rhodospirillaceae bacterium]|jgi:suppressor for copper-sensitivity B|nr:suppressor for copper-sensitivity [Rhodospirillaceae bacterium]
MKRFGFLPALALGLLLVAGIPSGALAQSADSISIGSASAGPASDWAATAQSKVRLIAAVEGNGGAKTLPLGLQFQMQPGWKTYWRSPGDAGLPASLDWSGSTNLADAHLAWPAPQRFTLFGLDTFGYEDEVVLPIEARPADPTKPLALRLKVDYLVCERICIPMSARLSLALPAGPPRPSEFAQLIDRYASRVPGDGAGHGLKLESVGAVGEGNMPRLKVSIASALPLDHPDLIVEGPAGLYFPAPQVTIDRGGRHALFEIAVQRQDKAPPLAGTPLALTMVDGHRGLEAKVVPASAVASPGLGAALLAALLGGLILNLMPCVLPVLSLKLLAFVGHGGASPARVRLSSLASTAGVLASFFLLAAVLAGLKTAGIAIGWGLQFQQPLFLAGMALVLTFFAGNLWGWFEVPLPGFAGRLAESADRQSGLIGDFFTGALATLLATPCTAPFLATAIGFALTGGVRDIFMIFAALGLGLAAPYLLIACLPGLATRLPRPGRWMLILKRLLGAALIGTALWLLQVLTGQIGRTASIVTGLALLAVLFLLALPRLSGGLRPLPGLRRAGLVAAAAATLLVPAVLAEVPQPRPAAGVWQDFSEAKLATLLAEGKVVLVDVTADWCINCRVNEALVFDRGWTADALAKGRLVGLRADWTRPDPAVTHYLASFGRYGIPFNAVYGPQTPQGIVLPTVLSEQTLSDSVRQAGGS